MGLLEEHRFGARPGRACQSFPGAATTPNTVGIAFVVLDPLSCGTGGQTTVYVGLGATGTSIYRSSDGGTTWTALAGQPTTMLPSHAAVSATGQLYVTYGGGTGNNGDGPNNVITGAVQRMDIASGAWTDVTPSAPVGAGHVRLRRRQHRRHQPQHASWSARSIAGASATRSSAPPTGARPGRRSTPRARRTTSRRAVGDVPRRPSRTTPAGWPTSRSIPSTRRASCT